MYEIDSEKMKPNHELVLEYAKEWGERGFKFNKKAWREVLREAEVQKKVLAKYGIENPNSPRELGLFFRGFRDLRIGTLMYNLKEDRWDTTIDKLEVLAREYSRVPEIVALYRYKKAEGKARLYRSLESRLDKEGRVSSKVKVTETNRIMFVDPFISGLPKKDSIFMPTSEDSLLVSVDVKAQEPTIIINWYGSDNLKRIVEIEEDIYTGIAKEVYAPEVWIAQKKIEKEEYVGEGYSWRWRGKDALLYMENTWGEFMLEPPKKAVGVFESGKKRELRVKWEEERAGVYRGRVDIVKEKQLTYELSEDARDEIKVAWQVLAYGGNSRSVEGVVKILDAGRLVEYIRGELKLGNRVSGKDGAMVTYFGTELESSKKLSRRSRLNRSVQGTASDIVALLVEHFYNSHRPEGVEIYMVHYDEIVLEVPKKLLKKMGSERMREYLLSLFEHKIDDFTPFIVEITLI